MSDGGARLTAMRPAIKAGLLMVWRDPDTLQIGIDPRRAVALRGMRGTQALINLLDGSRDLGQVLAAAHDQGIGRQAAERVIGLLAAAGARPASGRRPDLAVLTDGYPPELPGTLVAGAVAHLTAAASEAIGVVGPLVIPGRTACLSCVDLARSDRDPAWPLILAQASGRV